MRSRAKWPVASWPAKIIIMVHSSGTVLLHMYVVSYVKASLTFQAIGCYWNGGLYVCLLRNRNTIYFQCLFKSYGKLCTCRTLHMKVCIGVSIHEIVKYSFCLRT